MALVAIHRAGSKPGLNGASRPSWPVFVQDLFGYVMCFLHFCLLRSVLCCFLFVAPGFRLSEYCFQLYGFCLLRLAFCFMIFSLMFFGFCLLFSACCFLLLACCSSLSIFCVLHVFPVVVHLRVFPACCFLPVASCFLLSAFDFSFLLPCRCPHQDLLQQIYMG